MSEKIKINKALLPFSWLYGLVVGIRNKLFDWKILPVEKFDVPVISIGNLSVGGTGKTPHTEYLIRLLSKKYKIAVLSRGYRRKSSGFILADETADSHILGDEPYQMFRKFPEILLAVDANRRRGIHNLLNLPDDKKPKVILLDDAFQHRYVKPSLSILLTDSNRPFYDDYLLPAGRLREPATNAKRADIILFTKCPPSSICHPTVMSSEAQRSRDIPCKAQHSRDIPCEAQHSQDIPCEAQHSQDTSCEAQKPEYQTSFRYKSLLPVFPENNSIRKESIERLKKESYSFLLIAGLARPEDLIQYLKNHTSDLQSMIYADHHDFSRKDILDITDKFNAIKNRNKLIITSEKDAARLMHNPYLREEIKALMYYVPIEVVFEQEQEELFTQKIENHVRNFTRNRIMAEAADTRRN